MRRITLQPTLRLITRLLRIRVLGCATEIIRVLAWRVVELGTGLIFRVGGLAAWVCGGHVDGRKWVRFLGEGEYGIGGYIWEGRRGDLRLSV